MRILILTHVFYPSVGGIEVHSEILANEIYKTGHDVRLITLTAGNEDEKNFAYQVIRKPSLKQLFRAHKWADVVIENNPCLHLSWPNILIQKPRAVALHTWISRANGKRHWQDVLKLNWLKRAGAVIANSSAIRKKTFPDAVVIGNPYNSLLFRRLPEIEKKVSFVFLGRLVSDKGTALAIDAFAKVVQQADVNADGLSRFSLTIIGDGPEKAALQKQVVMLQLQDAVQFTGILKGGALVRELNKHSYLVVPSLWEEPFGNIVLEGMACGCLPIASDGGGLPDAVGNAGFLFKRGDVGSLANTILHVLSSPGQELQARNNISEHLKTHSPAVIAEQYMNVVQKLYVRSKQL